MAGTSKSTILEMGKWSFQAFLGTSEFEVSATFLSPISSPYSYCLLLPEWLWPVWLREDCAAALKEKSFISEGLLDQTNQSIAEKLEVLDRVFVKAATDDIPTDVSATDVLFAWFIYCRSLVTPFIISGARLLVLSDNIRYFSGSSYYSRWGDLWKSNNTRASDEGTSVCLSSEVIYMYVYGNSCYI